MRDVTKPKKSPLASALVLAGIFLFLLSPMATFVGGLFVKRGMATAEWPTTPGTVDISHMETEISRGTSGGGSTEMDVAKIAYAFDVAGQTYRGDRISTFDHRVGRNTERAKEQLARYPVGKKVTVSYDPLAPHRSVLEPGVQTGAKVMVGAGIGFFFLSMFLFKAAGRVNAHGASLDPAPASPSS
jgi:hypothetical protein